MVQSRSISSLHEILLENIRNAILAIPKYNEDYHSILRNLQKNLVSMKPLLLVQMDPTRDKRFRYHLETLDTYIPHLAKFKEKLPELHTSYWTELKDLNEILRNFFRDYVQDQLERTHDEVGPAEGGVRNVYQRSREIRNMIINEMPKASYSLKYILEKLQLITDSLILNEHEENTSEMLRLLNRVRVCVKFLNGDHDIDIQINLRNYEQELRKFVNEETWKKLKDKDRQYEDYQTRKSKEELSMFLICIAAIVACITYAPQTLMSAAFFVGAITLLVCLCHFRNESPEKANDGYKDIVNLVFTPIVVALFTYTTQDLMLFIVVIGAFFVYINFFEYGNPEPQRKEAADILFLAMMAVGTIFACLAYWQNTLISCIAFISVIVLLVNLFKNKFLELHRRNGKDELKDVIKFFAVTIFIIGATIMLFGLFMPKCSGKEEIRNEIFLSFRGSDTRYIFASSLHNNLEKANIRTFFDERNMRKGKQIWEELQMEIRTSAGAIIILSENYAESEDCLDELLQIQERASKYQDYIIKPIFYDVEPEHLTDKRSKFYQALQKHRNTKKIKKWAGALKTLTGFAGYPYRSNWHYMDEFIDKVVGDVKKHRQTANGRQVRKYI